MESQRSLNSLVTENYGLPHRLIDRAPLNYENVWLTVTPEVGHDGRTGLDPGNEMSFVAGLISHYRLSAIFQQLALQDQGKPLHRSQTDEQFLLEKNLQMPRNHHQTGERSAFRADELQAKFIQR
jgi:hypothetical protein